jgi:hypothetical protein
MDSGQSGMSRRMMVVILLSVFVLYYVYNFLYSSVTGSPTVLVDTEISVSPTEPYTSSDIPQPFEGGEYTFNTWIYVNNYRTNQNIRKPIFELKGKSATGSYATLFVGLGAQSNTLVVRTHSAATSVVAAGPSGDGTLFYANRPAFLSAVDNSLTDPLTTCDLPSVDLQRWVMITVVLNGRTIDVYMDGKMARSCVTPSYYKVDPEGVIPVILGGTSTATIDADLTGLSVAGYAMNPGDIYRTYSAGPKASQTFMNWVTSMFSTPTKT